MRVKVDYELKGLAVALRNTKMVADEAKKCLGPAVKAGANIIKRDAQNRISRRSGQIASGIVAEVTWDKNASKAFAGVAMSKEMNNEFVYHTKMGGVRYYIPSAVEYGHRAPGGGGYVLLDTIKRGKRAGQFKAAASSKQGKVAKPVKFMRNAVKSTKEEVKAEVTRRIYEQIMGVVK